MGPGGGQHISNLGALQSTVPVGVLQHFEPHEFPDTGSEGKRCGVWNDSLDLSAAADPICAEAAVLDAVAAQNRPSGGPLLRRILTNIGENMKYRCLCFVVGLTALAA